MSIKTIIPQYLLKRGFGDFLMHKKVRGKDLTLYQKTMNKSISKIRYVVEQTFGLIKLHMGFRKLRYIGLTKAQMEFDLIGMASNLKKASSLVL